MKKKSVVVVITARPSYSRTKTALRAIDEHPYLELKLIVAASALLDRYGKAINYIEADGFSISDRVFMVLEGENPTSMAKTTGIGILELATVFDNLKPDVVVTIADRFETMATAIAASYMNIPLVHIQGGEVTGNIDEKVRHAITKLADIHLVASENAAERVIKMGERPETVFVTGCPSIDLAAEVLENPEIDFDIYEKYGGAGNKPDLSQGYVVVMQHPVTSEHELARTQIEETLYALYELGVATLCFWPNVDAGADGTSKGIRVLRENKNPPNMQFFMNMDGKDFLKLLYHSKCIIGNSSVGIRECAFLGVPAVNIGSRQSGRQRGENVFDVDYDREAIKAVTSRLIKSEKVKRSQIYGTGNSGVAIANILADYSVCIEKKITY